MRWDPSMRRVGSLPCGTADGQALTPQVAILVDAADGLGGHAVTVGPLAHLKLLVHAAERRLQPVPHRLVRGRGRSGGARAGSP